MHLNYSKTELIFCHFHLAPPTLLPFGNHQFVLCIYGCFCLLMFYFLGSTIFHCMYVSHLLYPFTYRHLGCFPCLAGVNDAAMNSGYTSFQVSVLVFFGQTVTHELLLHHMVLIFLTFLRNLVSQFHEGSIFSTLSSHNFLVLAI